MKLHKMILIFLILFLSPFNYIRANAYKPDYSTHESSKYNPAVVVDLTEMKLYLFNRYNNNIVKTYPVAGGKSTTRSPVGNWKIMYKAANWGAGFGSRWMALNVPWGKFGIHGTNKPYSIGGAESEGCIRMLNHDVEDLYGRVFYGTPVRIYGGPLGLDYNSLRHIIPGDRGGDVYEIQRLLMEKSYYSGKLDGLYGDGMKSCIIKYRKDHKLQISHDIDTEFYKSIGIIPFD